MSNIQFVATATLTVSEGFNVQSYLDSLSERCVKEDNFIAQEYGEEDGKADIDLSKYVNESGGSITIATDSEESNSNNEVWEWLVDQFIPIMESEVAVIKSASISYKFGVDIGFSLISKTKGLVSEDEIVEVYSEQATD